MPIELQKSVTLDEAMLDGFTTYLNGCNFALRFCDDRTVWMNFGCYMLPNLATGSERLLLNWLRADGNEKWKRVDDVVSRETIAQLQKRIPCRRCGGFEYALQKHNDNFS